MKHKLLALCALLLLCATPASAQITIPFTFVNGQTADADAVNSDMSALGAAALNRTGGTLTGNLAANAGVTIDGIDVGATVCTACAPTLAGLTLTGALSGTSATFSTTLGVTGASTLAALSATTGTFSGAVSGSAGTFTGAVTGATLVGTLTTATQNSVTTMTGLTSVGTIATGTWNATILGISKGGTGVSLSGTGGTSQFLRQNSAGATITVVQPAVADLSDASTVALLNAANTFAPGAVAAMETFNSTAANGGYLTIQRSGVAKMNIGVALPVIGAGTNNDALVYTDNVLWLSGDGGINFADVGVKRWGINTAGDFTVGASAHISDSVGTPTISSGFDTGNSIAGTDYAFVITKGTTTANAQGTIAFGHTWTTAPSCTVTASWASDPYFPIVSPPTTTTLTIAWANATTAQEAFYVHCRSY